jgi:hypothetical protein
VLTQMDPSGQMSETSHSLISKSNTVLLVNN